MSGARFSVLIGAGARLARALINFMLDLHTREHGYTEVEPPFLVNADALRGTGNLPKFEQDLFKIAGDWDLYLIPTAEVPLTNLHRRRDPRRRAAAAALHGLHAVLPQRGGLVRRRRARADPPAPVRQGGAREVHDARAVVRRARVPDAQRRRRARAPRAAVSDDAAVHGRHGVCRRPRPTTSRCGCRARRRIARFRPAATPKRSRRAARTSSIRAAGTGKAEFVHTLNGSGLAVGRTLIAILENYQQKDGSVIVPEVLRPYVGGQDRQAVGARRCAQAWASGAIHRGLRHRQGEDGVGLQYFDVRQGRFQHCRAVRTERWPSGLRRRS